MVDQASSNIMINAEKRAIMAVIADFDSYPQWSTAVKSVTTDEVGDDGRGTAATFTIEAGVVKDTYSLAYTWSGDDHVEWTLTQGQALKSQHGSYELKAVGDATEVTYRLAVELNVPMPGMFKRKAEKMIIDTALKGLKRRVESA